MVKLISREFTTAADFLNALRLSNHEWSMQKILSNGPDQELERGWIFRGESSVQRWRPLVPQAWRIPSPGAIESSIQGIRHNPRVPLRLREQIANRKFLRPIVPMTEEEQKLTRQRMELVTVHAFGEILLINSFASIADELGFVTAHLPRWTATVEFIDEFIAKFFPTLPIDSDVTGKKTESFIQDSTGSKDFLWTESIVALAQHHGVPTRLLDWTKNPLYAAYFAAESAVAKDDDCIAVYAINTAMLGHHVRLVRVPAHSNDYLRKQYGVFTLDTKGEELYLANGQYPSLEESLAYLPGVFHQGLQPRKYILPVSEVQELLRLLWLERITKAHLMPTLDNVAVTVKEQWRFVLSDE